MTVVLVSQAQKDTAYIHTFGGDRDEEGRDIQLTSDDGFITVGTTSSFGAGQSDIYLLKVDSNIAYQWSKAIGHAGIENGRTVRVHPDGGYLIAGFTNSIGAGGYDGYLVRTDDTGSVIWEKTFGGMDWDFFYDMVLTDDKGCIAVGQTHSSGAGNGDAWAVRIDKDGNLVWEKTFGGAGEDGANGVIKTKSGDFVFCGYRTYFENNRDVWVVFNDKNGRTQTEFTDKLEGDAFLTRIASKGDTNFLVIGSSNDFSLKDYDIIIYNLDYTGAILWKNIHGNVNINGGNDDFGEDIKVYGNGNVLLTGTSFLGNNGLNIYTAMANKSNGGYMTAPSYGGDGDDFGFRGIIRRNRGELFVGSTKSFNTKYSDLVIVEIDTVDGNKTHIQIINKEKNDSTLTNNKTNYSKFEDCNLTIYPNPTKNVINIFKCNLNDCEYHIYNSKGIEIFKSNENLNHRSNAFELAVKDNWRWIIVLVKCHDKIYREKIIISE